MSYNKVEDNYEYYPSFDYRQKPKLVIADSTRICKCRFCNRMIKKDVERVVFKDLHTSAKIKDLHFHVDCFNHSVKQLKHWLEVRCADD
jgi:hypothetical protein